MLDQGRPRHQTKGAPVSQDRNRVDFVTDKQGSQLCQRDCFTDRDRFAVNEIAERLVACRCLDQFPVSAKRKDSRIWEQLSVVGKPGSEAAGEIEGPAEDSFRVGDDNRPTS